MVELHGHTVVYWGLYSCAVEIQMDGQGRGSAVLI